MDKELKLMIAGANEEELHNIYINCKRKDEQKKREYDDREFVLDYLRKQIGAIEEQRRQARSEHMMQSDAEVVLHVIGERLMKNK